MSETTVPRRHTDGSIDFDFYRNTANRLRQEAIRDTCRGIRQFTVTGFAYFKLPQNRWMRRHASSRSSVLVA